MGSFPESQIDPNDAFHSGLNWHLQNLERVLSFLFFDMSLVNSLRFEKEEMSPFYYFCESKYLYLSLETVF